MRNQPSKARDKRTSFARTEAVYTFIRDYARQEGFPPSLREIAHGCDLGRTTVLTHLHRLLKMGLIRRLPGKARAIILVDTERQKPWEPAPLADLQPMLEG